MSVDNIAIGRRFFEELLGQGKWDAAVETLSGDVVMHHPSSPEAISGREAVKQFLGGFRAGFPDLQMTVEDAFTSGDKVAIRWRARGRHTGELFGVSPTGKQMNVAGISILRIADGKIVEDWVAEDTLGMLRQLGVLPSTES
jgi:steroid delta-isomerase-like uncharacterized protein